MTVEQLNVIISAQNAEFNRRMDEVNDRLDDMSDTAEQSSNKTYSIFKGLAGKLAALGIGKLLASSITEGMNAIESESLFETSLGGYSDEARKWSEELGDSLGLDDYALRKNVGTLYTMTKNMGVTGDSALDMSKNFTKLAEDMASFYNLSSDEAFAKLKSGLTGEAEPLKALGILVDENTVKQYAYKNGIAEMGAELTQTQKVMARYAAIMDQTSTAQGDLARTIDSPSNQLRIIKNEVKELMRDTGTALMPTVSSLLNIARAGLSVISPIIGDVANGVNTVAQAVINASPTTKKLLVITLGAALAIPAVTKAQMLLTAAQGAYKALLSLLIPKQLTFAAALKATAGWIGIIAAAMSIFSLINDANAQATDTAESTADEFKAEGEGAEKASDGIDGMADSLDDLGTAAKGSLLSVDKLNVLKSGSGSVASKIVTDDDLDMLADANSIMGDIEKQIDELKSNSDIGFDVDMPQFDFSNLLPSLWKATKEAWEWLTTDGWELLKQGFETLFAAGENMWTVLFGDDQGRYDALLEMTDTVEKFFGKEWVEDWKNFGSQLFRVWSGINLEQEGILSRRYSDLYDNYLNAVVENMQEGQGHLEAAQNAYAKVIGKDANAANYFFEHYGSTITEEFLLELKHDVQKSKYKTNVSDYIDLGFADPSQGIASAAEFIGQHANYTASLPEIDYYNTGPQYNAGRLPMITLDVHVDSYLDGDKVGEGVASRQVREEELSGGY